MRIYLHCSLAGIQLRNLGLQLFPHLIRKVIYIHEVCIKGAAVDIRCLAYVGNRYLLKLFCLQKAQKSDLYISYSFLPALIVLRIHWKAPRLIIPTLDEILVVDFIIRLHYTAFTIKTQLLFY